jgi:3'-phosphoadenosine 5'-phosphosulfate sulfotransferase (PAPS reductase)/FAD synthetase
VVGVLLAERAASATWEIPLLRILTLFAEQRLERDVASRRSSRLAAPSEAPRRETTLAFPTPPPEFHETELALAGNLRATQGHGRLLEAQRYARLLATDIRLYNEEAVLIGRRRRDLAERLEEPLRRARESFRHRFADLGEQGGSLLEEACTDVLAAGDVTAWARS